MALWRNGEIHRQVKYGGVVLAKNNEIKQARINNGVTAALKKASKKWRGRKPYGKAA